MAVIAKGDITLTSLDENLSVSLSPNSCVIRADFDGSNPSLDSAHTDISLSQGVTHIPISASNLIITPPSGVTYSLQTISAYVQRLSITGVGSNILSGAIQIKVNYQTITIESSFQFSFNRESTMLDWIQDWEDNKTKIGSKYILTPKIYAGKHDSNGKLTGIYIGPDSQDTAGIYGYKADQEIFRINADGASLGGWSIETGGIMTSDGKLKLLSDGSILSSDANGNLIYGLYKSGEVSFAKGNVLFHSDGSASFTGSITASSGSIGGWNIASRAIWKNHLMLDSSANYIGLSATEITQTNVASSSYVHRSVVHSSGGVCMFYNNANSFGLEGYSTLGEPVFQLGSTNNIAGWTIGDGILASPYLAMVSSDGNAGIYLSDTDMSDTDVDVLYDHITDHSGIMIIAGNGFVSLSGYADGQQCFKIGSSENKLAVWHFDHEALWVGGKAYGSNGFLTSTAANAISLDGSAIRSKQWVLSADGSGKLAGGKIAWTISNNTCTVNIDGVLSTDSITVGSTVESCMVLSKTIMVRNSNNVVNAGMSAEGTVGDSIRFWAGGTYNNRADESTPFRVTQSGKFYASNAEITGKVIATSGQIGGWSISGSTIVNTDLDGEYNNDSAIIFRNDQDKIFVGIGTSTAPASFGASILARFENLHQDNLSTSKNYGIAFNVNNAAFNLAFCGVGNGVLNGIIAGSGVQEIDIIEENATYQMDMKSGDLIVLNPTVPNSNIMMPRLDSLRRLLDINATTPFHIKIAIIKSGTSPYFATVYFRNDELSVSGSHPFDTDQYPAVARHALVGTQISLVKNENFVPTSYIPYYFELIYDGTNYYAVQLSD